MIEQENMMIYYGDHPAFDVQQEIERSIQWIRDFFIETDAKVAVVGISGGKDSSVVAALCSQALGKDNVIGIKMPNGVQSDWEDQDLLIEHLGIRKLDIDISPMFDAFVDSAQDICVALPGFSNPSYNSVPENMWDIPESNRQAVQKMMEDDDAEEIEYGTYRLPRQAELNLPARIRMCVLYMIAQSLNVSARVANTCNLSEDWVGYSTRWGDGGASDFAVLQNYTATEVIAMGRVLGLPEKLITKAPADGLCGKTDEENLGFTYAELDRYIRTGVIDNIEHKNKIDAMHIRNEFKMHMPPACPNELAIVASENIQSCEQDSCVKNIVQSWYENMAVQGRIKESTFSQNPGMDVTFDKNIDQRGLMVVCPNCHTNEHLNIKCDIATLNSLEYWVECDGCEQRWTEMDLGLDYVNTPEELIQAWNQTMGECDVTEED